MLRSLKPTYIEMIAICSHARACIEIGMGVLGMLDESETALKAETLGAITMWRQTHDLYAPLIKDIVTKSTARDRWEANHE